MLQMKAHPNPPADRAPRKSRVLPKDPQCAEAQRESVTAADPGHRSLRMKVSDGTPIGDVIIPPNVDSHRCPHSAPPAKPPPPLFDATRKLTSARFSPSSPTGRRMISTIQILVLLLAVVAAVAVLAARLKIP